MKKIVLIIIFFSILKSVNCQETTLKEISNFPEDYIGKTFTFKNIWWYPTLVKKENKLDGQLYYQVMLDISGNGSKEFAFGAMENIMAVTIKPIARQLTTDNKSGYNYNYYGDIKAKVIKTDTFGSDYLFVITEIVHHYPGGELIKTYK